MNATRSTSGAARTVSPGGFTCGRPAVMRRTIDSAHRQTHVDESIVLDGAHREATGDLLLTRFPNVSRVPSPATALAANRNSGIRQATGEWILLLDDDTDLDPSFVQRALVQATTRGRRHVFHAAMREGDSIVLPNAIGYLGFLTRATPVRWYPAAVSIQACFFAKSLFALVGFDEAMVFGYEEIDFACRAAWAGYPAWPVPDCVNVDLAPDRGSTPYKVTTNFDANRIYMRFKHLWWIHQRRLDALLFVWVALLHVGAAQTLHRGPASAVRHTLRTCTQFSRTVRTYRTHQRRSPTGAR